MVVNGIVIALLLTLVAIEFYKGWIGAARRQEDATTYRDYFEALDQSTEATLRRLRDATVTTTKHQHQMLRSDITELWGIVEEKHERVVRLLVDQVGGTLAEVQGALVEVTPELTEIRRLVDGATHERLQIQRELAAAMGEACTFPLPLLEEIAREVSDPATLRILRKLEAAFLLGEGMESQPPAILSTTASPNMARQLEERAFSERTIRTGADDLIAAAAARGITLPESEARRQAMLMLNDEEV